MFIIQIHGLADLKKSTNISI